ncbi:MAG: response regulator [Myxococcota bacterium]
MTRSRVLCIDDEKNVLDGLQRVLRQDFDVSVALGPEAALELLKAGERFDIVLCDMRMPGMNGAQVLSEFRRQAPDTVRILLTGHSELEAAIAAVNEGHIFRFLTKPCPPATINTTLRAAALQRRLLASERVLLEQTLVGSIRALCEVLTLTHPEALGPATRQHERARLIADKLGLLDSWHVEVASMLASVGYVMLPAPTLNKVLTSKPLDDSERDMLARLPSLVESILSHIPRLESVREVLKHLGNSLEPSQQKPTNLGTPVGARILRAVQELGAAEARLGDTALALKEVSARRDFYGNNVFEALLSVCAPRETSTRDLKISEIAVGMVLMDQVKTDTGMVVVAGNQRVTPQLLQRLHDLSAKMRLVEPIRCEIPAAG